MHSLPYLEPICCFMSSCNCCFLTCIQISQEAGQVVWYSHLLKNFPQFAVIHIPIYYVSIYLWTGTWCVICFLLRLIVKNVWKTPTQRNTSRRELELMGIWKESHNMIWENKGLLGFFKSSSPSLPSTLLPCLAHTQSYVIHLLTSPASWLAIHITISS